MYYKFLIKVYIIIHLINCIIIHFFNVYLYYLLNLLDNILIIQFNFIKRYLSGHT